MELSSNPATENHQPITDYNDEKDFNKEALAKVPHKTDPNTPIGVTRNTNTNLELNKVSESMAVNTLRIR
jgi:hypothetical protein